MTTRKFGDIIYLPSETITYASNAASVTIPTPTAEQVLVLGMETVGGASRGLFNRVTRMRHLGVDRILGESGDVGVMLSHMASTGQRIAITGESGKGQDLKWYGDGAVLQQQVAEWARLAVQRDKFGDETHSQMMARALDSVAGLGGGNRNFAGFVVGGIAGGDVEIDLTDLSAGSDEITGLTLYGIHLGTRSDIEVGCGQHNSPMWLGMSSTVVAGAASFERDIELILVPGFTDYLLHVGMGATFIESGGGTLSPEDLENFRVSLASLTQKPQPVFNGRVPLNTWAGGNGAALNTRHRMRYDNHDRIGLQGDKQASNAGDLHFSFYCLSQFPQPAQCQTPLQ